MSPGHQLHHENNEAALCWGARQGFASDHAILRRAAKQVSAVTGWVLQSSCSCRIQDMRWGLILEKEGQAVRVGREDKASSSSAKTLGNCDW